MGSEAKPLYRFGAFRLDAADRLLYRDEQIVPLPPKAVDTLLLLVASKGHVLAKDDLIKQLWPNTFVEESTLTQYIFLLRKALRDGGSWIENVPRRGYRFTAAVEEFPAKFLDLHIEEHISNRAVTKEEAVTEKAKPGLKRRVLLPIVPALLLSSIGVAFFFSGSDGVTPETPRAAPLTAFPGQERDPALSPDGSQVAFAWNGQKQDNFDIYVMRLDSNKPVRLTSSPADEVSPAWSPDGLTIAFLRRKNVDRGDLLLMRASGGPEHTLVEVRDGELSRARARFASLAWSPDGKWIAGSHRQPADVSERIYLFSRTGEMRPLTSPPPPYGDHTPAFSSDGRNLAFTRLSGGNASDIYQLRLDSNLNAAGEAQRLTTGKRWCVNPVWLPGRDRILYLELEQPSAFHELRITAAGRGRGSVQRIPLDDAPSDITVSLHDLVYSSSQADENIWRARIAPEGEAPSSPELFITSTRIDDKPRYSPDGSKIAFTSSRSGSPEIWVSQADGSNPVPLTTMRVPLVGYASWSPDGQRIAFHARPEGQGDVFVMPAAGGAVQRLTSDAADDVQPSYSHDGLSIYFSSTRSGRQEIWKMPAAGGEAEQVTTSGAARCYESPDGKTLVYLTADFSRIESVPVGGGLPSKIAEPLHSYPTGFAVTSAGVYYEAPPHAGDQRYVRFFSFATGNSRPVAVANRPFALGMTISPDGKYVLFDQLDESGSDLMLVRDFHKH